MVVSQEALGEGSGLLWVVMITSAENRPWPGDIAIDEFRASGLPAASVVRPCKIATIEGRYAEPIGRAEEKLRSQVRLAIHAILGE